jgi:hypothetical protein
MPIKGLTIEGEPSKRFRVYNTDLDGHAHDCVGAYDTLEELKGRKNRLDQKLIYRVDGRFMQPEEFWAWVASQG